MIGTGRMVEWSAAQKSRYAARRVAWTILPEVTDDGVFIVRVKELAGLMAAGETDVELAMNYSEALESFLLSYFEDGDSPPVPGGTSPFPWDSPPPSPIVKIAPLPNLVTFGSSPVVMNEREAVPA